MSDMKLIMENWRRFSIHEADAPEAEAEVDVDWRFPWKSLPPDELQPLLDLYTENPLSPAAPPEIALHPQLVDARRKFFITQWEKCSGVAADTPYPHSADYLEAQVNDLSQLKDELADTIKQKDQMIGTSENFENVKDTPEFISLKNKIAELESTVTNLERSRDDQVFIDFRRNREDLASSGFDEYGCTDWMFGRKPKLETAVARWEEQYQQSGPGRDAKWNRRSQTHHKKRDAFRQRQDAESLEALRKKQEDEERKAQRKADKESSREDATDARRERKRRRAAEDRAERDEKQARYNRSRGRE